MCCFVSTSLKKLLHFSLHLFFIFKIAINANIEGSFTFTFSHLANAFIQSDLQLGIHKVINLEEANKQRKCS